MWFFFNDVQYKFDVFPPLQHSFGAAMTLYEQGNFVGASQLFEEALVEYYKADVECRALCQGQHQFEDHDHLRYRYSLYEVISGKYQHHPNQA